MKGITHFLTGVTAASFFGKAVELAETQQSLILALGGVFGIMADTLDFKFGAFFTHEDHYVDPDPLNPDPQAIAAQIGKAIEQAYDGNRMVKVKCHTVRLGADLWRQYVIRFDPERGEVIVIINPIVTMSQVPYMGTEPKTNRVGRYKLRVPLVETHGRPTVVDIMSGPEIGFKRVGDHVEVEFIPFHRTWSHSLFVGFLAAGVAALIASFAAGWHIGWYYGLVALTAYYAHLLEDVTGHMGASYFWPFRKKRTRGLKWFKAQNPHSNFIFNYSCVMVIIFNINRFSSTRWIEAGALTYFFYTMVLPLSVYIAMVKLFGEKKENDKKEAVLLAERALHAECDEMVNEELV